MPRLYKAQTRKEKNGRGGFLRGKVVVKNLELSPIPPECQSFKAQTRKQINGRGGFLRGKVLGLSFIM
jgi:hypothetical protein